MIILLVTNRMFYMYLPPHSRHPMLSTSVESAEQNRKPRLLRTFKGHVQVKISNGSGIRDLSIWNFAIWNFAGSMARRIGYAARVFQEARTTQTTGLNKLYIQGTSSDLSWSASVLSIPSANYCFKFSQMPRGHVPTQDEHVARHSLNQLLALRNRFAIPSINCLFNVSM